MTNDAYPTDPVEHSAAVETVRDDEPAVFEEDPGLKNSMVYWFPPLRDTIQDLGLSNVHVPDTLFVDLTPINTFEYARDRDDLTEEDIHTVMKCPADWDAEQIKHAADHIGYPAFIRTDTDSDKHNIETAGRLTTGTTDEINETVQSLICGVSANSGMIGEPRFNYLAVREWVDIDSEFTAFDGTPIGPEVRIFVTDGTVQCHHFYWPFHDRQMRTDVDGEFDEAKQTAVEEMEAEIDAAMDTVLRDAAREISTAFDGTWAIDFARSTDGDWYAIDMSRGHDSWHPTHCEHVDTEAAEPVSADELNQFLSEAATSD